MECSVPLAIALPTNIHFPFVNSEIVFSLFFSVLFLFPCLRLFFRLSMNRSFLFFFLFLALTLFLIRFSFSIAFALEAFFKRRLLESFGLQSLTSVISFGRNLSKQWQQRHRGLSLTAGPLTYIALIAFQLENNVRSTFQQIERRNRESNM